MSRRSRKWISTREPYLLHRSLQQIQHNAGWLARWYHAEAQAKASQFSPIQWHHPSTDSYSLQVKQQKGALVEVCHNWWSVLGETAVYLARRCSAVVAVQQ